MRVGGVPNGWLPDSGIWSAGSHPTRLEVLHHVAEPVVQFSTPDVGRLPPLLKEGGPNLGDEGLGVAARDSMSHDVGNALLKVLHVTIGFLAGYKATHVHPS